MYAIVCLSVCVCVCLCVFVCVHACFSVQAVALLQTHKSASFAVAGMHATMAICISAFVWFVFVFLFW